MRAHDWLRRCYCYPPAKTLKGQSSRRPTVRSPSTRGRSAISHSTNSAPPGTSLRLLWQRLSSTVTLCPACISIVATYSRYIPRRPLPERSSCLLPFIGIHESSQGGCRRLGRQVSLGRAQQLKSNHELADGGESEQWRIEVWVELPFRMREAIARREIEAHRIREWCIEDAVVTGCYRLQHSCQSIASSFAKAIEIGYG